MKNKKNVLVGIWFGCYLFFAFPQNAHAYLDPGTGSMLVSVVVGLLSTVFFAARKLPAYARTLLYKMHGKSVHFQRTPLVMYAESAAYWNTFRPLLEECGRRNLDVLYLTSAEHDPVFQANLPACITAQFIGTGNAAYTRLNFVEADAFVLTTPGLDVLQIRRSSGVGKYIHVVHSPGDIHSYKLFSFDFYDAVFCSCAHQVRSLRTLEATRRTTPKELPVLGCPYYDVQCARLAAEPPGEPAPEHVLLAPSWGKNGMLTRTGAAIPRVLAEAGFQVLVRPHPQSSVSEKPMLEALQQELACYANIHWDFTPDGFPAMNQAAVLVSDWSGIILDFAFLFLRPVVTLDVEMTSAGFEAFDLPYPPWVLTKLDQVGKRVKPEDIAQLPALIRELQQVDMRSQLAELRAQNVANFGHAAGPIVGELSRIVSTVHQQEATVC